MSCRLVLRKMVFGRSHLRSSIPVRSEQGICDEVAVYTSHRRIYAMERSRSIPDQSSSILLIVNAQYTQRRSDSPPFGSAEKLQAE